ncbi:hypothetical protein ABZZ79_27230 [Streptomyces sp. NPDC006458]|uniref:hypothetical protein n=1 Tax=Streptomyces sp. NPDC006458 TaxID=3154302 RepID=UPI0033A92CBB
MPLRRLFGAGLGAGMLLVSGCGGGDGDGGPDDGRAAAGSARPSAGAAPAPAATDRLVFPLDAYDRQPADQSLLARAQDELAVRCMARYGFRYVPPERARTPARPVNSRVFGVVDPREAAEYGYRRHQLGPPAVLILTRRGAHVPSDPPGLRARRVRRGPAVESLSRGSKARLGEFPGLESVPG